MRWPLALSPDRAQRGQHQSSVFFTDARLLHQERLQSRDGAHLITGGILFRCAGCAERGR